MNILLRVKNWQLFLMIIPLPWIVAILLKTSFDFKSYDDVILMSVITIVYYSIFLTWNYKVIKTFNKNELILKPNQLKRLDWLLVILIVYGLYIILPMQIKTSDILWVKISSSIIMLFAMYAILFTVFCTAKTLKGIQLKSQLRTSDIIVEMFIILYFPVGVWWLQQKVNKFYKSII
jgi:hypothetical protein